MAAPAGGGGFGNIGDALHGAIGNLFGGGHGGNDVDIDLNTDSNILSQFPVGDAVNDILGNLLDVEVTLDPLEAILGDIDIPVNLDLNALNPSQLLNTIVDGDILFDSGSGLLGGILGNDNETDTDLSLDLGLGLGDVIPGGGLLDSILDIDIGLDPIESLLGDIDIGIDLQAGLLNPQELLSIEIGSFNGDGVVGGIVDAVLGSDGILGNVIGDGLSAIIPWPEASVGGGNSGGLGGVLDNVLGGGGGISLPDPIGSITEGLGTIFHGASSSHGGSSSGGGLIGGLFGGLFG